MIKFIFVTGSIDQLDYEEAKKHIGDSIAELKKNNVLIFLSGRRRGAERIGERYAQENGFRLDRYLSDIENDGEKAQWLKTKKLLEICDLVVYLGSGDGFGEKQILDYIEVINKPIRKKFLKSISSVISYEEIFM